MRIRKIVNVFIFSEKESPDNVFRSRVLIFAEFRSRLRFAQVRVGSCPTKTKLLRLSGGSFFRREKSRAAQSGHQPLTEPSVMPLTKYFWKNGYAIISGSTAMTAIAMRTPMFGTAFALIMPFMWLCRKAALLITSLR